MNKIKKIIIILQLMALIIGGYGCEMKKEKVKQEPTLNEWQKEFLAEQGLPTEYSELNITQQLSVDAIYEMIMYLEEKYGIGFEYTGYVRPQILEEEYMTAIPEGGNAKTDTVTVTREDDGTFTDDYPNIAVRPYYEQMVTDYIKDYFNSDKIKVFSTVTKTTIKDLSNISEETIRGNVIGNSVIFISNEVCTENEIESFASIFVKQMQKNNLISYTQIMLLYNPNIGELNVNNYSDYFSKKNIKIRLSCHVKSDGSTTITDNKLYD